MTCAWPVWQALHPALRSPKHWDVLVAHFLGLDHVGHAHSVGSPLFTAKLQELNYYIQQVPAFVAPACVMPA